MYICLKDGFLALANKYCGPDELMVRARRAEHIKNVFPDVEVRYQPQYDYHYTAVVSKKDIVAMMTDRIMGLQPGSVKAGAVDEDLSNAYYKVWDIMEQMQYGNVD